MAPVYNENLPSAVAVHVAGLAVPVLVVVRYLFWDVEGLFAYVSAFGLAGLAEE